MKSRIIYIDKLKGLAILFMVMGHVAQISLEVGNTTFNKFYTSFHMPLFMFLSGMFIYKYFIRWNIKEYLNFVCKKALRILVPFFSIGCLYSYFFYKNIHCLFDGTFNGYWFLPALFLCMIIDVTLQYAIKSLFPKAKLTIDIIFRGILFLILVYLYSIGLTHPYYRGFIYHYPFFFLGVLTVKYPYIHNQILFNTKLPAFLFIGYIVLWNFTQQVPFRFNLISFFSIPLLIYLFNRLDSYIPNIFSFLGLYSMEIYIFHRFFLPSLTQLGNFLTDNIASFDKSENFILFLLITLIIAIPICFICIIIGRSIKEIPLLKKIIMG